MEQCKLCNKEFSSKKGLNSHVKQVHKNITTEEYFLLYIGEKYKCPSCGEAMPFVSLETGYSTRCSSRACRVKSMIEKSQETSMQKYGTINPMGNPEVSSKSVNTKKQKYGENLEGIVNKVLQTKKEIYGEGFGKTWNDKTKEVRKIKYGDENYNNRKKAKETSINTYGTEYPQQSAQVKDKTKNTNIKKHGTSYYFQSSEFLEKQRQNNLIRYGKESFLQTKEYKEKTRETLLKRYGVENVFSSPEIQEKIQRTNTIKYGYSYPRQNPEVAKEFSDKVLKDSFCRMVSPDRIGNRVTPLFLEEEYLGSTVDHLWKCNLCGEEFKDSLISGSIPRCLKCYPIQGGTSLGEKELADYVESLIPIVRNKRFFEESTYRFELDIFIPSLNIGIEYNGLYYHSEVAGSKNKKYHISKTDWFKSNGIQVIHIFESEWLNKQAIIKSMILSKIGKVKKVGARTLEIKEIPQSQIKHFLEDNHLQGWVQSSKNLALFKDDKILSVLSLGKSRFNKRYEWEVLRFANALNISVLGGFSRMLKYFIKKESPKSIVTYADKRYSTGNLYEVNGFTKGKDSSPGYFYTKNYSILESRIKYQKHKLKEIVDQFDPSLTEWENMRLNKYDRIWDCGNTEHHLIF